MIKKQSRKLLFVLLLLTTVYILPIYISNAEQSDAEGKVDVVMEDANHNDITTLNTELAKKFIDLSNMIIIPQESRSLNVYSPYTSFNIETPTAGAVIELQCLSSEIIYEVQNDYREELIDFTDDEVEMIERLVEAEATSGNVIEKSYVASVIINRIKSEDFPNTVKEVVFQRDNKGRYQFSPIADGRYYSIKISNKTHKAVQKVIEEGDTAQGALFFMNPRDVESASVKKWFKSLKFLFKDGIGHYFYK